MFERNRINNDSIIGSNSNGNTVIQGSQVYNPTFILGSGNEMMGMAAQLGRYDIIQDQVARVLESAKRTHPLYPEFSAGYNTKLGRLVSTPETADALRTHPKKIKGTYRLDYSRYPHMDKSETPWEYAYRTQSSVEMDTTSYQEYLGDIEDPFPVLTYVKGMTTIISAPEFPDSVEAMVVSGDVAIPIQLRRLPYLQYGWLLFGNVSENHGFDIRIKACEAQNKTTVTFNKKPTAALEIQLLREKLFMNMATTRKIRITVSDKDLVSIDISEQDVTANMFAAATPLYHHFENLLSIEQFTGCKFTASFRDISPDDYYTAQKLASSIKGEWHITRGKFDNGVCADHDRIAEEIMENPAVGKFGSESSVIRISLHDQLFTADKAYAQYHDARISNFGAVKRAVCRQRKNIRIIIKPLYGKDYFLKYVRFDGLRRLTDEECK